MTQRRKNSNNVPSDASTQIISNEDLLELRKITEKIPALIVIQGNDAGRIFKLTNQAITIGRAAETHFCVNDQTVSRKHCLLEVTHANVILIDLESSNGTFINGQRITKKKLINGDKIQVGSTVMKFEMTDIDESEFHEQIYHLITFDDLTSLFNRKYLFKQLELLLSTSPAQGAFSLLFLDLDHFKQVNDTHDHLTGSGVLSEFGRLLLSNLRSSDIPCRYGGEEFIIILPETTALQAAFVAEKIRKLTARYQFFSRDGEPIQITVSVGIAEAAPTYKTPEELIARSDEAMYQAKEHGRNKTVIYREDAEPHFILATPMGIDDHTPHTSGPTT